MKHAIQVGASTQKQGIIQHESTDATRLNKFISESGLASRRGADRLIQEGKVAINGKIAEVGTLVYEGDTVNVNGHTVSNTQERVYIVLNKPVGITCTTDLKDASNIVDFMHHELPIFPIGRLDKDSHGLILLTNDGNIVNKILREENGHDKEYIVSVHKQIDGVFLSQMAQGVDIYNPVSHEHETTKPCTVRQVGPKTFNILLHQGLNRQIRRMTKSLGYRVTSLKRTRVMNILLGQLKPGEWRYLTTQELSDLNTLLKDAKSHIENPAI